MNINFHYFAVKTIARKAGISEKKAQMLASYSQLIDDFDIYAPIRLDNVPDFARHLAEKSTIGGWWFYPVTTGFNSNMDMARLILEENQRLITVPFHFVTKKSLNQYPKDNSRQNYRSEPTHLNDGSLMSKMLSAACAKYKEQKNAENLMRIGMLIHTFADTYAHQSFSGLWGWENDSKVIKVIDNNDDKNLTSKYKSTIYENLPAIGHTNVYHAPDDSFVRFDIELKLSENDRYIVRYNRSNTKEFTIAAREIYNYLCECFGVTRMDDDAWNDFIKQLTKGFLFQEKDIDTLCKKWETEFPGYNYNYSKSPLMASALVSVNKNSGISNIDLISDVLYNPNSQHKENLFKIKDEMFFRYNVIAKEIRDKVNGKKTSTKAVYKAFLTSEKEKQKLR